MCSVVIDDPIHYRVPAPHETVHVLLAVLRLNSSTVSRFPYYDDHLYKAA
jgi:hypothetical protein